MATLDSLLYEHTRTVETMGRLLVNLKKSGRNNFTPTLLKNKQVTLSELKAEYNPLDRQIYTAASIEQRKVLPYFKDGMYLNAENVYYEVSEYISNALHACEVPVAANANSTVLGNCTLPDGTRGSYTPLPRIDIPKFSGSYTEWVSFRDMFQSLVINNKAITNVQKLHYLKMGVSGEASSLLKTVTISDVNFSVAWDKLKDRYENSRHIIDSYLTKLYDVSAVQSENVKDLKRLRDQTYEAMSSLSNLHRPMDHWDDLVPFMTVRKLDPTSRREWEMRIGEKSEYPNYQDIHKFLDYRIRALESILPPATKRSNKPQGAGTSTKAHLSTGSNLCECEEHHALHKCEQFRALPVEQRQKFVRAKSLCNNCLAPGHPAKQCRSKFTCYHCKAKHHSLLHLGEQKKGKGEKLAFFPGVSSSAKSAPVSTSTPQPNQVRSEGSVPTDSESKASVSHAAAVENLHTVESLIAPTTVMLATAWVTVASTNGRTTKVRALLDQGSQSSFVTESIVQTLNAARTRVRAPVSGIGGIEAGTGRATVTLTLTSRFDMDESVRCTAIVFQKLTSYIPPRSLKLAAWHHLHGLDLADPEPGSAAPIHMILGADIYALILREGLQRGPSGSPVAQKTIFGWILAGPTTLSSSHGVTTITAHIACDDSQTNCELRRFWELEEVPSASPLTEEESACESHFVATHYRLPDGRYCVKLPFKTTKPIDIGCSRFIAEKWLATLERKFTRNAALVKPYSDFMGEYLSLNHMVPTTFDSPDSNPAVYLPHHPVFKESSTTKLRVVFNASSTTSNGTSLNDHLMVGPKLQADLPTTILRWRQHKVALTADITKMYRQIIVDQEDTKYQQILWRPTPEAPVTPYRLVTVTYGTASAPYQAMRVLKQLADDEESNYPRAATIVRNNFYVDDVLFGANDESTAAALRQELNEMLQRGGFTLRKWMSSHAAQLADTSPDDREKTKIRTFDDTASIKILGIGWVPETDSFCFNATAPTRNTITKRSILSITAQLFDPLGWLAPIIVTAKILLQELWIALYDWDDELPQGIRDKWKDYCQQLPELQSIAIPRWNYLTSNRTECELHGFADASTRAYAAVVYLRTFTSNGEFKVSLLAAKTKVAPIRTISVPRLELCAAVLLSKLIEYVKTSMQLHTCTTYAWTDSNVVLAWIRQHASTWPTFVANRVATIQTRLKDVSWRHVPTSQWPRISKSTTPTNEQLRTASQSIKIHLAVDKLLHWELYSDVSSWPKLVRVTAYCIRFIDKCRKRSDADELRLSGNEIDAAQLFWIKDIQREKFTPEIRAIQAGKPLPRGSPLRNLTPFIDDRGTLRVGGRLERSNLNYAEKHPAILPQHRVSTLIVEDAHLRSFHGGPQLTISIVRQNYWIIGHRPFVRNLIRKCVPCARERARVPQQLMGNLPAARVDPTHRAFEYTGLDYAGPFLVRTSKGRGHKSHKAYLALFVCMSTRAIHLEIVSDYSSAAFLAAYRRFIARRGLPSNVYSDNGTTFQGAEKELRAAFHAAVTDTDIGNTIATDKTTWHFIPPGAPHFGGLWEAGVKSAKHHLKRVLGTHTLTYEELNTRIAQIEACFNSRPIGPLLTDPCEYSALTPGHFLIGAPLLSVPEPSTLRLNENRLSRWQLVQHVLENFWKRWSAEYFHSLQVRPKWTSPQRNVAVGDLVLIRNNNLPPSKWMLGKIVEVHPGSDQRVRVVTVRTANSEFKRPITQICLLPINAAEPDSTKHPDSPDTPDSPDFHDCETFDMTSSTTPSKN